MTTNAASNITPEAGNPQQEPLVYNITHVSRLLCISESLCYRLCNMDRIPGVLHLGKLLVVSRVPFDSWLDGGSSKVATDDQ